MDDLFSWADAAIRSLRAKQAAAIRDHDARWLLFVESRPDVADRVLRWCRGQRDAGENRIGMAACWEALRGSIGKGKCMDNSLRAPAARWVVAQDPTLEGLIEMRQRKVGTR